MFINNLTKKRILVSVVASSILMFSGCGSNSSSDSSSGGGSNTQTASLVDSPISGIDYNTSTQEGITGDNGDFTYSKSDKYITFKIGDLKLADFNLSKIKPDHKVLIGELFNLDRNDTTNEKLIKTLRVLQSLDNDGNSSDGILINDNVKGFLDTAIENNTLFNANLVDNNISTLRTLVAKTKHKLIGEREARDNYVATLKKLGYTSTKMPFITVWEVNSSDKNITIPINPKYAGEYNYTVDWGDENVSEDVNNSITHTYSKDGNYTVKISGNFPAIYFNNAVYAPKLISVNKWGDIKWKSFYLAFYGCNNLVINSTDTSDLSQVTSIAGMFANCYKFNQPLNDWNVSNVTDMRWVFYSATSFNQPLNDWNVSNVTDMKDMFDYAKSFNQPLNDWNVSNVTDMGGMFSYAKSFNQPLNNWNVSNVTDMNVMFYGATSFNQPLNNWNVSNVTDMKDMFSQAYLFNQPLNNWNVSNVTDMSYMFYYATSFNQPLNNWNVSNVTDMSYMFCQADLFNQPLNDWNVSNVTTMKGMFYLATSFNQPLNDWNVSKVTDMVDMFGGATSFDQNISMWDVSKVTDYNGFADGGCPINGTDKMPKFK